MAKKCSQTSDIHSFEAEFYSNYCEIELQSRPNFLNQLILVKDDSLGDNAAALGGKLMTNLLTALLEKEPYPRAIVFLNRAVMLTLNSSPIIRQLRRIESRGVAVLSSQSCLAHYGVSAQLAVGYETHIQQITELMKTTKQTIVL